jgi:hypothetical protein
MQYCEVLLWDTRHLRLNCGGDYEYYDILGCNVSEEQTASNFKVEE